MNKLKMAKRLAKEGRNHLYYVSELQEKEYDLPDGTPEDRIDSMLMELVFKDLEEHKKTCPGCAVTEPDAIRRIRDRVGL